MTNRTSGSVSFPGWKKRAHLTKGFFQAPAVDPEVLLGVEWNHNVVVADFFSQITEGVWCMRPLTLEDLIPLEDFQARRKEFLSSHLRYLDTYRKVRVGARALMVFENRQTLWFRVQDVFHLAKINDPRMQQEELELHNRVLPTNGGLQAALLLDGHLPPGDNLSSTWSDLRGDQLRLCLGGKRQVSANLLSTRPEDRCWGTAHWVHFRLEEQDIHYLADRREPVKIQLATGDYQGESAPLNEAIRQSLVEDLSIRTSAA